MYFKRDFQKVRKNKRDFGLFEKVPFQKGLSESPEKIKALHFFQTLKAKQRKQKKKANK